MIKIPASLFKKREGAKFVAAKMDYSKERKRVAAMGDDDDDDDMIMEDGNFAMNDDDAEPSESFAIDDSREISNTSAGVSSPSTRGKSLNRRKTDWGLSPIETSSKRTASSNTSRDAGAVNKSSASIKSNISVKMNRMDTSVSADGSHNSFSQNSSITSKGGAKKKRKGAKGASSADGDEFDFDALDENTNSVNKKTSGGKTAAAKKRKTFGRDKKDDAVAAKAQEAKVKEQSNSREARRAARLSR